jgi:hypothetical protein
MTTDTPHTPAWTFQAWCSFLVAVTGSVVGIYHLPCDPWTRAFLGAAYFFTVASSFSLAKTVRDQQEHARLVNRIKRAREEQVLRDFETDVGG